MLAAVLLAAVAGNFAFGCWEMTVAAPHLPEPEPALLALAWRVLDELAGALLANRHGRGVRLVRAKGRNQESQRRFRVPWRPANRQIPATLTLGLTPEQLASPLASAEAASRLESPPTGRWPNNSKDRPDPILAGTQL